MVPRVPRVAVTPWEAKGSKTKVSKTGQRCRSCNGPDCPVALVWRASWPDQRIVRATLATTEASVAGSMERTALILVGHALAAEGFADRSLHSPDYDRRFRPQRAGSVERENGG